MKYPLRFISCFLGLLVTVNMAFGWWVFDPAKEKAFQDWQQNQISPAAKKAAAKFSGDFYLYSANELSTVFRELGRAFNEKHPDLNIWQTTDSNRALLKTAVDSTHKPDVLTVSSEALLSEKYFQENCDWYISYSSNEIVLLYTPNSQFANEINQANWSEVLTREATRYGYIDPRIDEVGSRTIFSWQLAEKYYQIKDLYLLLVKKVSKRNVFKTAGELLTALNKGELDYGFHYRTFALENNVKLITLPPQINLGSPELAAKYQLANFKLRDPQNNSWLVETGKPIINLITIPTEGSHKEAALAFVEFCLSESGIKIMLRHGLIPLINKEATSNGELPAHLKKFVTSEHVVKSAKKLPEATKKSPQKIVEGTNLERPKPPILPSVIPPTPPRLPK